MKHKTILTSLFLSSFLIFINIVYAPAASLGSGYAVTNNRHGIDVPIGSEVVVTAMTTDNTVYQVTFLWKNPGEHTVWTDVKEVSSNESTYDNMLIYYADSSYNPDDIGDWGVQAIFQGPDGTTKQQVEEVVAIKATSFNHVPEIPIIGTAGSMVAMLLGFKFFTAKKKHN